MDGKIVQPSFEFRRRIDKAVHYFHPCEPMNDKIAWKREDNDLWVTFVEGFGWVCIDSHSKICGVPWGVAFNKLSDLPPEGEWVSKKGDKSYVYDLIYI